MAIFTKEFILHEKYVSKYAKYLDDDDFKDEDEDEEDDDEDEEDDDKESSKSSSSKSSNNHNNSTKSNNTSSDHKKEDQSNKPGTPEHLSKEEIRRIMTIATSTLMEFPKLKKCCDYIDLNDRDHINDDGERESSFGKYYSNSAKAFIKLMDGDTYSGYPDFKEHGSDEYEKDARAFVKKMNEILEDRHVKAKFMVGSDREDDAISFGVKSIKEK